MKNVSFGSLTVWILRVLIFLPLSWGCSSETRQPTPNVLFIAVDDLRPELNCYGAAHIFSPNIDRLANEGLLFQNAYCNIPVCGASRTSLMTGLRPTLNRFRTYHTWADEDAPGNKTLPAHFRQNGYYTISNGKVFHHREDAMGGWDEIWFPRLNFTWRDYQLEENIRLDTTAGNEQRGYPWEIISGPDTTYADGKIALKAVKDLERLKEMDQPFFLAAGFLKPHLPFNAPQRYWDIYDPAEIILPAHDSLPEGIPVKSITNWGELRNYSGIPERGPVSAETARQLIHGYYACVSYTDAQIGIVLNALDELGLAENTIVILWGDHGWNLNEHGLWCKHSNFDTSTRAALMLKVPGRTRGEVTSSLVEFIDIYPTLAELCGLSLPEHLEGKSMVSLLENPESFHKDFIIAKWQDGLTLKTPEYAYTEWTRNGKEAFGRMLFDHISDPEEIYNLAIRPENEALMDSLSNVLNSNKGSSYYDPVP